MATKRETAKKPAANETKKPAATETKKPAPKAAPEPEVTETGANEAAPGITDEQFSDAINDLNEVLALDPALDDDCNPDDVNFVKAVGLIELTDIYPPNKTDPALKPETVATFKALGFTLPEPPASKGKAPKPAKAPKAPKAPKEKRDPSKTRMGCVVKAWVEGKRGDDLLKEANALYGDDNEKETRTQISKAAIIFNTLDSLGYKISK